MCRHALEPKSVTAPPQFPRRGAFLVRLVSCLPLTTCLASWGTHLASDFAPPKMQVVWVKEIGRGQRWSWGRRSGGGAPSFRYMWNGFAHRVHLHGAFTSAPAGGTTGCARCPSKLLSGLVSQKASHLKELKLNLPYHHYYQTWINIKVLKGISAILRKWACTWFIVPEFNYLTVLQL